MGAVGWNPGFCKGNPGLQVGFSKKKVQPIHDWWIIVVLSKFLKHNQTHIWSNGCNDPTLPILRLPQKNTSRLIKKRPFYNSQIAVPATKKKVPSSPRNRLAHKTWHWYQGRRSDAWTPQKYCELHQDTSSLSARDLAKHEFHQILHQIKKKGHLNLCKNWTSPTTAPATKDNTWICLPGKVTLELQKVTLELQQILGLPRKGTVEFFAKHCMRHENLYLKFSIK